MKNFIFLLVAVLVLVSSFAGYQIVQAGAGEGTATIDGAANVTVVQSTSHKFTVVLTIGVSGITADALNPTFTIPAGFTAPNSTPVANVGAVTADGQWFATAAGGTCTVDTPPEGTLTGAVGQLITVNVTTTCATGHTPPDTITLTYQGQSSIAMAATALVIKTADDATPPAVIAIAAPPTITVTAASSGNSSRQEGTITVVKTVVNDSGGTKTIADFPLFINNSLVVSGVAQNFRAPSGPYTVTETNNVNYTQTFSGDCDANGRLDLNPGENKFCIITNNDIGASLAVVPPLIDVVKTASPLSLPNGPGPVTYTYTLRNMGTVPVTNVTMVGDTCGPIVLASGDTNGDNKLDLNETWVHTCTTTLSATHTNTVVATGWANGISAIDIASATVVVGTPVVPPLIHVVKVPSVFTLPAPGGAVTYIYTVTNPGTAPLSNVSINDNKCTGLPGRVIGHPGDLNNNNLLESNEVWTFTCKSNLTQTTTNTGTAAGSANGLTARDFALATVVVASPILPNTGLPPRSGAMPWDIVMAAGILMLVSTSLVVALRKR